MLAAAFPLRLHPATVCAPGGVLLQPSMPTMERSPPLQLRANVPSTPKVCMQRPVCLSVACLAPLRVPIVSGHISDGPISPSIFVPGRTTQEVVGVAFCFHSLNATVAQRRPRSWTCPLGRIWLRWRQRNRFKTPVAAAAAQRDQPRAACGNHRCKAKKESRQPGNSGGVYQIWRIPWVFHRQNLVC